MMDFDASPNCLLCETVIKEAEKHFTDKKSKAQIKASLEHACAKMPKLEKKCDAIVDKYGDRIVDLIILEFTPKQICRELGMCILQMEVDTEEGKRILLQATPLLHAPLHDELFVTDNKEEKPFDGNTAYIHAGDSTSCVMCQTVMTQLENQLKDKTTQKEVVDTVKNVCHTLPKKYDAECSKFIDSYATLIITLIDTTPPKEICTHLSLCSLPAITESKRKCKVG